MLPKNYGKVEVIAFYYFTPKVTLNLYKDEAFFASRYKIYFTLFFIYLKYDFGYFSANNK